MLDRCVAVISGLVGLTGIVLSFVFYLRSRRRKLPLYYTSSKPLTSIAASMRAEVADSLQSDTTNLTATFVAFWNAGEDTIRMQDVATSEQIRILPNERDTKILYCRIVSSAGDANGFEIALQNDGAVVQVGFEFMAARQGLVVICVHTGSVVRPLYVSGYVVGAGRVVRTADGPISRSTIRMIIVGMSCCIAAFTTLAIVGVLGSWHLKSGPLAFVPDLAVVLMILIAVGIAPLLRDVLRRRTTRMGLGAILPNDKLDE